MATRPSEARADAIAEGLVTALAHLGFRCASVERATAGSSPMFAVVGRS